jgi:penicillin-binding protein 2
VAFAPVESPRIAVAVLAEHMGHGGSAAAPLAKELIETYVKLTPQVPIVISKAVKPEQVGRSGEES